MKYDILVAFLPTLLALGGIITFYAAVVCFEHQRSKRGIALYLLGALCFIALMLFHYIVDMVKFSSFMPYG